MQHRDNMSECIINLSPCYNHANLQYQLYSAETAWEVEEGGAFCFDGHGRCVVGCGMGMGMGLGGWSVNVFDVTWEELVGSD